MSYVLVHIMYEYSYNYVYTAEFWGSKFLNSLQDLPT